MITQDGERVRLLHRGFWLEYTSIAWMVAEAGVAITAGIIASSIALVGFGLDSVIELFSAGIVVWQLRGEGEERETRRPPHRGDVLRAGRLPCGREHP